MPLIIPGVYPQVGVAGSFDQNEQQGSGAGGGGNVGGPTTSGVRSIAIWLDNRGRRLGDSAVSIDAGGNIITDALVDGRDVSQDGAQLDLLVPLSPTADQKAALVGTGVPSGANPYVTDDDPRLVGGRSYVATATSYVATVSDYYIGVTALAADVVITLPSVGVAEGQELVIKDESGTAGAAYEIRVAPAGADLLDGLNGPKAIIHPHGGIAVVRRDDAWWII